MKKAICCVALVMALLLCACGHSHTAEGWQVSGTGHWKECGCGEKFSQGDHELDDELFCKVCGAEVFVWDDGTDVNLYDQNGNPIHSMSFDSDGNMTYDFATEYIYDEDGNILTEKTYDFGTLQDEIVYVDGEVVSVMSYYDEGCRTLLTYDENGNLVTKTSYDGNGNVIGEDYSEFALTADGEWYESRCTSIDTNGSKYIGEYNEWEDQIAWITYTPDGVMDNNERYEYTYDEEGHKTAVKIYSFDALVQEKLYTMLVFEDGWMNYPGTIIDYHEDGGKTVCVYDENDELVSQTHYDAEGNVIE